MGFHDGVRVSGAVIAGLLVCANLLMRTNSAVGAQAGKRRVTFGSGEYRRVILNAAYLLSIMG